MRTLILLASTAMLAACGGAGPQSAGSAAPGGSGGGVGNGGGGDGSGNPHTFVNPTEERTYTAVGSSHSYSYGQAVSIAFDANDDPLVDGNGQFSNRSASQIGQLYQGDATTVRNSNLTIAFNPRDAIFDVSFSNELAGTSAASRFQDPLHRTDFGGMVEPQFGTPNLGSAQWNIPGINYLESGSSDNVFLDNRITGEFVFDLIDRSQAGSYDVTTFFFQTPGTETQFVTFAGYLRNRASVNLQDFVGADGTTIVPHPVQSNTFERGAFAYGELTANDAVPTTGTGSFSGRMLASMVFNDQPDVNGNFDTYFQWIAGQATTNIDFGANTFDLALSGTVGAPFLDGTSGLHTIQQNAEFFANGGGQVDLVAAGGFFGAFNEAWFVNPDTTRFDLVIAGSSINGAFYGPNAEEVGGGYRIVGGTPDERIDILGTFVGQRP